MMPSLGPFEVLLLFAMPIVIVWPTWRICRKAGFPGAISLLCLIPLANLFLLYFLAFAEWPAVRRQKEPLNRDFDS
jgi:hypothetical protein